MEEHKDMAKTVSTTEAIRLVGVSRTTFWRLLRRYSIPNFQDVLDGRVKLIRKEDLERLKQFAEMVRAGESLPTVDAYRRMES
jgi:ACT domain-containing protein